MALSRSLISGAPGEYTCLVGTMAQEAFATSLPVREACVASISGHAETLEVDRYLAGLDRETRRTLDELRRTLLELLPDADQGLSYGVPAFRVGGKLVAGFSVAKHHLNYLPHSGTVLAAISPADLEGHGASKGAVRFTNDNPLSRDLVARLVADGSGGVAWALSVGGESVRGAAG